MNVRHLPIPLLLAALLLLAVTGCKDEPRDQDAEFFEDQTKAPGEAMEPREIVELDDVVAVGPLAGELPEGWTNVEPSSSMRQAEYHLEPAEGDEQGATVTVFYFGPDAGSVKMNIDRWMNQFGSEDGGAITEEDVTRETFTVDDMKVTMVRFAGTMKPSSMPGAPKTGEKSGWMNVSAIVETPQGPWFFKGTGPEATMLAHLEKFKEMLKSLEFAELSAHG